MVINPFMGRGIGQQNGAVIAVCTSPKPGIPKYPRERITITAFGAEGDFHAGPARVSHRTGKQKPNDRPISILAKEVLQELNQRLGIEIPYGGFGENILVEGLGTLSDLRTGDRLKLGKTVIIEVTEQNVPCSNLQVWHKQIVRETMGRRGIIGLVIQGGTLQPGDPARRLGGVMT